MGFYILYFQLVSLCVHMWESSYIIAQVALKAQECLCNVFILFPESLTIVSFPCPLSLLITLPLNPSQSQRSMQSSFLHLNEWMRVCVCFTNFTRIDLIRPTVLQRSQISPHAPRAPIPHFKEHMHQHTCAINHQLTWTNISYCVTSLIR